MIYLRPLAFIALAFAFTAAYAQDNSVATGNMHFSAKDMDTSGDKMISMEEMQKYAEKMWDSMAHGKAEIPIETSTKDFASAGVNFVASQMDTDRNGKISKEEFLAYTAKKYDGMQKTNGMVTVNDMATAIARGNQSAPH